MICIASHRFCPEDVDWIRDHFGKVYVYDGVFDSFVAKHLGDTNFLKGSLSSITSEKEESTNCLHILSRPV